MYHQFASHDMAYTTSAKAFAVHTEGIHAILAFAVLVRQTVHCIYYILALLLGPNVHSIACVGLVL